MSKRRVSAELLDDEDEAPEPVPAVGRRVSWLWKRLRRTLLIDEAPAPDPPAVDEPLREPAPVMPWLGPIPVRDGAAWRSAMIYLNVDVVQGEIECVRCPSLDDRFARILGLRERSGMSGIYFRESPGWRLGIGQ